MANRTRLNLKLAHKGLILVAVPLIFQLIFVGILWHLLQQAEYEREREAHAREVVTYLNKLLRGLVEMGGGLASYNITDSPEYLTNYNEVTDQLPRDFQQLWELVKDDPEASQSVKRMEALINEGVKQTHEIKLRTMRGSKFSVLESAPKVRSLLKQLRKELQQVTAGQEYIEAQAPIIHAQRRQQIQRLLIAGVIFNIVLALFLAIYFTRGVTRRLAVLMDNTGRVADGLPLNPPVGGTDEIAHLDAVFTNMAGALASAETRKQELLSMVTHDLRSPLSSVQGLVSNLSQGVYGELTGNVKDRLSLVNRNVNRLMALINDLLDIEKMKAGKLDMKTEIVELSCAIERAVELVKGLAEERKIEIKIEAGTEEALADEDRIVQVLVNLLSNALKFAPPGTGVSISTGNAPGWVTVKVHDEGPGIPADKKEAIFERFTQVESTASSDQPSTGLGLAICKAIVEQHGGTIGVDSTEGQGSTFWISLPKRKG